MQVESATPDFSPPTPASSHSSPPMESYSFPSKQREAARSPSPSEFSGAPDFSPAAVQAARAFSYDPPASVARRATPAEDAARAMSVPVHAHSGVPLHYDEGQGRQMYDGPHRSEPVPLEFSALGRQIVGGGPVQRVIGNYPFAEYLEQPQHPDQTTAGGPLLSAFPQPPPHPLAQFHGDPSHADFVQRHAQMNPQYSHGNPAPGQWAEQPPPSCCGPGAPEHHHGPPPSQGPPRFVYGPDGSRMVAPPPHPQLQAQGHAYYTPYSVGNGPPPPGFNMVRTVSANSSSSSGYSESDAYSYSS